MLKNCKIFKFHPHFIVCRLIEDFLPVKLGGLGLFRIKSFLDVQTIRWVAVLGAGIETE
jgi:hypothetical protein